MIGGRRPGRRVLGWAAALLVGIVALGWLWSGSDYANTSLRTAPADSTQPPDVAPPDTVGVLWRAESRPTSPTAVEDGMVIVGDPRGLRGLDPASGTERWHYLRSTAELCDWTAQDGVVVAAFRSGDGCDEAVALDAGTGARVWYRSVRFVDDVTLASTNQLTVASTPTGLTTLGTTYNGIRWRYDPPENCLIAESRPGDVGVAVVLDCDGVVSLQLLDGFTGEDKWSGVLPPGPARIVTASGVVGVLTTDLTGALQVFDREGVLTTTLRDPALVGSGAVEPGGLLVGSRLMVFTGSALVAVDTTTGVVSWVAQAQTQPVLLETGLLVYDGVAFVQVDVRTGLPGRTFTVSGPAPEVGASLRRVGPRIVVSTAQQVAVYG